jgi:hypothetical protein
MSLTNGLIREGSRLIRRTNHIVRDSLDRWSSREEYSWPHHVVFIAGLPKSGTTWMKQLMGSVPGYKPRWPFDPDRCVANHDVCEAVFATLPWDLYSVVKLHTRCTPANLAVVEKFGLRTGVMLRDLRDQCVSRYFHVLHDQRHRHHAYYNRISKEAALFHSLEITIDEQVQWIKGWLPVLASRSDRFLEARYEELRADPQAVLSRVLSFYEISLTAAQIAGIIAAVARRTTFDVRANLRSGKGTARKGIKGDWRNHFTPAHVRRFKEGCGEFLVQLGYEKNLDWQL